MNKRKSFIKNSYIIGTLIFVFILAVIFIVKPLSFFHVRGYSMNPTLKENDLVFCFNTKKIDYGDIVAFEHKGNNMIKRVIGKPGDTINMDQDGNVYRNGQKLEEEYVRKLALGEVEIKFPYEVPDDAYFLLGDNRVDSLDSRSLAIGSVKKDEIIGKILFKK